MSVLRGFLTRIKSGCTLAYRTSILFAGLLFIIPISVFSQGQVYWQTNGITVCDSFYDGGANSIAITNDGFGNSIIIWRDNHGPNESIFAQKVDINGNALWLRNGACIVLFTVFPSDFACVSDGRKGAILTWTSRGVRAQRVDSLGIRRWGGSGMLVSPSDSEQYYPAVVEDGSGGAIIAFFERKGLYSRKLIMQRIDRNGNLKWGNGVMVSGQAGHPFYPSMKEDNRGGAFIVWSDSTGSTLNDLYTQYVDSNGVLRWGASGKPIYIGPGTQCSWGKAITTDGINGFVINWYDKDNWNIYAQRIDSLGNRCWGTTGVSVCIASGMQIWLESVNDINQEVLSIWSDCRSGGYIDLYAQNIDTSGQVHWQENGVFIARAAPDSNQRIMVVKPQIVSDNHRGFIVTYKKWSPVVLDWDIYAQRVDSSGNLRWDSTGVTVCTCTEPRRTNWGPVITEDSRSGAVIAWGGFRDNLVGVYAQRVGDRTGIEENAERLAPDAGRLLQVHPNPFRVKTVINYTLSTKHQKDKKLPTFRIYNASGRLVKSFPLATCYSLLPTSIVWDGSGNSGQPLPAGVYFVELRTEENRSQEGTAEKVIKLK